jgi:anti-sigma-K factor RskA
MDRTVEPHVTELLPAYSLGALDEPDATRVERHLATCAACQADLEQYHRVAGRIALAAPLVSPSPQLHQRLLARIAAESPAAAAPVGQSLWQRLVDFSRWIAPVWTPLSLLLIAGMLVANLWLWRSLPPAPALAAVPLTGTDTAPQAYGFITAAPGSPAGTLVAQGLPPLDPARQYQLWLIRDGQRTSGGLFSVSPEGAGILSIQAPQPLLSYDAFGITVEPAGGSPGPTGDRVLRGEL